MENGRENRKIQYFPQWRILGEWRPCGIERASNSALYREFPTPGKFCIVDLGTFEDFSGSNRGYGGPEARPQRGRRPALGAVKVPKKCQKLVENRFFQKVVYVSEMDSNGYLVMFGHVFRAFL